MAQRVVLPVERGASVDSVAKALDNAVAAPGPYLSDVDMEYFARMEISVMPKPKS